MLGKADAETGKPLVDVIVDQAEQKGTGRWTAQDALELGVPLTGITEAVFARSLSRAARPAPRRRPACSPGPKPGGLPESLVDDIRTALYASKVVAYAQGFEQMAAAAKTYDWDLQMGELAKIWRGGCIIRARFLNRITESYAEQPGPREPADGAVLPRRRRRRPGRLAQGDRRAPSSRASRCPRSRPRWPTTTATAASAARRT